MLKQDTTSGGDVNPTDVTGRLAVYRAGRRGKDIDDQGGMDSNRDKEARADMDASRKGRAVMRLQSMPNGEYPIRNAAELKGCIREWQTGLKTDNYSGFEIQRHIIRRARDLKLVALLPNEWGVNMEIIEEQLLLDLPKSADQLEAESRFFSAKIRRQYASKGIAMKDGSFPIPDKDALRRAVRLVGKGGPGAKKHIIKRARALGAVSSLPKVWSVNAEEIEEQELVAEEFHSFLLAEGKVVPFPQVLQESDGNSSTMKVKVPFYIGDAVSNAPGFPRRILFPAGLLQEIVKTGKDRIAGGMKPITVYARHAHAADANYLPIGGVSDLMQEGSVGYAVLDIEPTTYGKDAQVLLKANPPKLNAVSLRSGKNSFEMEDVEVNGEKMYRPKRLELDGIDFAPDSPAMKTYGIEILQENVIVKSISKIKEENSNNVDKLTLEIVKDHPEIISEIERPLIERLDAEVEKNKESEKTIGELRAELSKIEVEKFAREIAAKHPKSKEVEPVLLEIAATCKSKDEFSTKTFPILLEALSATPKIPTKELTPEEKLRKLFPVGGEGKGAVRENEQGDEEIVQEEEEPKGERVGPLEVPS